MGIGGLLSLTETDGFLMYSIALFHSLLSTNIINHVHIHIP